MRFQPKHTGIGDEDRQQGQRQHLQHRRRAVGKRRVEPEVMHHRAAKTGEDDGSGNTDPEGIGTAAAQNRAGFSDPAIANGLRGHYLHPRQQPDCGGDDHAGRRPAERLIPQFGR